MANANTQITNIVRAADTTQTVTREITYDTEGRMIREVTTTIRKSTDSEKE